jgi:phosphoglycerate kinase
MGLCKPISGIGFIYMSIPEVIHVDVTNKRVLVRVDFNVSIALDNSIANDKRIREALPTIEYLTSRGATVILLSHLGRPKGVPDASLSLSGVSRRLSELLHKPVLFTEKYLTPEGVSEIKNFPAGSVVLCENIRFHTGEEQNDSEFSRKLSLLGEIFVNDAFGAAHRTHASTVGVTAYLPSYAGLLLSREVKLISMAVTKPQRPLTVIIGGGKTPEKIRVIEKLLDIADTIYLGGAIANTFFATWGIGVGTSKVDYEMVEMARNVLWKATRVHARLLLPCDVVVSNSDRTTTPAILPYNKVPLGLGIYDIGPQALKELDEIIQKSHTVIWNGPMGLYEDDRFSEGTKKTCQSVASSRALSIVGGGDTISTITDEKILEKIDLISTGGSAMLEFIEKGTLPTIEALKNGTVEA